jgi:mRNA interferase RelE/StbE
LICYFKKTFLKDLAEVPGVYRSKIEKMVFEDIPALQHITDKLDIKKIQGYESYYRIRIGNYRVGCEILAGNKIIFYRVKNRKDIYKVFP